jgi:hypothetical protein
MAFGKRAKALALLVVLMLAAAVWYGARQRAGGDHDSAPQTGPGAAPGAGQNPDLAAAPIREQRAEQLSAETFKSASEVEPISAERLSGFLPDRLAGFERTQRSSERNEQTGIPVTSATATYAAAGGGALKLSISDLAGPKGVTAFAAWGMLADQATSSPDGHERTWTQGDRHYYDAWDLGHGRGEQAILLGKRFAVSVSGNPQDAATLQSALNEVNLPGIEALAGP